ncbi:MAG: hypothetical protein HOC09_37220 [Deltaproteobacteria bacterium]|jgi:hypothetical protein|nr:hypothetical protein [Deltaproteobacteria bacterium]
MKNEIDRSRLVIKFWMIFWFIFFCLRLRIDPWKFFQLNADYFNKEKGIYSKLEINQLIPFRWRLKQLVYNGVSEPEEYPVFLKPEWGQNSNGIYRADTVKDFEKIQGKIAQKNLTYLMQEAASEKREFEIYYIRQTDNPDTYGTLSITEVKNCYEKKHPINGVNNIHTTYTDITQRFLGVGTQIIWNYVKKIGYFRMARVCVKADSEADLLQGRFHIVEINLFTPIPINLLDRDVPWQQKLLFIKTGMLFLAKNAKAISDNQERKNVFFKKLAMHYKVKS